MAELRDYRMALHIHTRYSDGSGFVREIVAAGREAGLDVLVISDHNTLAARSEGWAGWHGSSTASAWRRTISVDPRGAK